MSAGTSSGPRPDGDLGKLAPRFREAVEAALEECEDQGLDAFVFEAYRSDELQQTYYERGRTIIPPERPVTNAPNNLYSWHGYGLAVDVISRSQYWNAGTEWFEQVAEIFKRHGCKWGGDWRRPDLPHMQWGRCKASPSDYARELIEQGGMELVWEVCGAA